MFTNPIEEKYRNLDAERERLGAADSSARTNPGESGKHRHYDNSHIYWSAETSAHTIFTSAIWNQWKVLGYNGSSGSLRYPASDPMVMTKGGHLQ